MNCKADFCDVSDIVWNEDMESVAKWKLEKWLSGMEPIDYDAPGNTARESGV